MPDSNEINARLAKLLVQALGVEGDEIKPSATLQGDLGAESIDFLDIVFQRPKTGLGLWWTSDPYGSVRHSRAVDCAC